MTIYRFRGHLKSINLLPALKPGDTGNIHPLMLASAPWLTIYWLALMLYVSEINIHWQGKQFFKYPVLTINSTKGDLMKFWQVLLVKKQPIMGIKKLILSPISLSLLSTSSNN
ncbi:MAG: hypothetical protein WCP96_14140 [Methylococcaceae bacterium]